MRRNRHNRGGWMAADALMAMAVILILASALAVAVSRQRKATARLADSRELIRLAENTLTAMQSGERMLAGPSGGLEVIPLESAGPGTTRWVKVRVTRSGHSAQVSGVVPADVVGVAK